MHGYADVFCLSSHYSYIPSILLLHLLSSTCWWTSSHCQDACFTHKTTELFVKKALSIKAGVVSFPEIPARSAFPTEHSYHGQAAIAIFTATRAWCILDWEFRITVCYTDVCALHNIQWLEIYVGVETPLIAIAVHLFAVLLPCLNIFLQEFSLDACTLVSMCH